MLQARKQRFDDSFLNECNSDLVQAQSIANHWVSPLDFRKKLLSFLKRRKSERPEYFAWFKNSFCRKGEIIEPEEIIKFYAQVIEADTPSKRHPWHLLVQLNFPSLWFGSWFEVQQSKLLKNFLIQFSWLIFKIPPFIHTSCPGTILVHYIQTRNICSASVSNESQNSLVFP